MTHIDCKRRRGGVILFVMIGILMIATWVCLDHTGRLLKLISVQRETMQRIRASDVPARSSSPTPCEASRIEDFLPERER